MNRPRSREMFLRGASIFVFVFVGSGPAGCAKDENKSERSAQAESQHANDDNKFMAVQRA